ncbi:MAG: glycosyltransferase family 8 protein [Planctomycetota bacterium]
MIQELQQQDFQLDSVTTTEPIVLCAADDNYVMPLAVTLHSAASNLEKGNHLHVLLMDGGISESNWIGLRETLFDLPISIHIIRPDRSEIADLTISHHITHTAYFRLLAARLLPKSISKVIYLDSDVLVRGDLTELWNFDLGNDYCAAVVDISCPFINAYHAHQKYGDLKAALPFLNVIEPIRNWRELGLDGSAHYFNSGVMVLNIARWREESIEQKLLACLRDNPDYVWCWDQYALNVVFHGQWKQLPAHWNQGAHVFEYPTAAQCPISKDEFLAMRDDPSVIHFTTEFKPWKYEPFHPSQSLFFEQLDLTAWNGWRPEKPPFSWKRWWDLKAVKLIRNFLIMYRRVHSVFR